jgi:hypothetical protein
MFQQYRPITHNYRELNAAHPIVARLFFLLSGGGSTQSTQRGFHSSTSLIVGPAYVRYILLVDFQLGVISDLSISSFVPCPMETSQGTLPSLDNGISTTGQDLQGISSHRLEFYYYFHDADTHRVRVWLRGWVLEIWIVPYVHVPSCIILFVCNTLLHTMLIHTIVE